MIVDNNMKYFCVWSEQGAILCLTTDYGVAIDVYSEHMINCGHLTDDSWSDTTAFIEEFSSVFPSDRKDIMEAISDSERRDWKSGSRTIMF